MPGTPKTSESDEFERGRRLGQEEQRALIAQELRTPFDNLTAAALALELIGRSDGQKRAELISTASSLLNKAIEELQKIAKELGDNPSANRL